MDDPSSQNSKTTELLDSAYEVKFKSTDSQSYDDSKDLIIPPPHVNDIYGSVATDVSACLGFMRTLTLEVVAFIYMFSYVMRSVSSTTMIIEKVCVVHMGYPEDLCNNLQANKTIKNEVEKLANNYHLMHTLLQVTPSAFLACFIGPWSDRYGRKLPITVALIGIIMDGFGAIICASYKYNRVEYYAVSALFTGLSGGFVSALTMIYSCASDTTSPKDRTLKYTSLELAIGLGGPLGSLAGGWIYKYSGYVYVFSLSVAGHCLGLLWVYFFIQETRGLDNKDPLRVKIRSFFTFESMMESFRTVSKRRPHRARLQIWLLALSLCIAILTFASTSAISYLFVYHQYNWGNTKYSTVSAILSFIGLVSLLTFVPLLTKVWKFSDAGLGIVGSASVIAKNITTSFAVHEGVYYLGHLFGLFSAMVNLAVRSRISKIVSKNDLGKVFSFISTTESLLPIVGTAAFAQLYNMSLGIEFPGLVYLVLGLLMITSLFVFVWIAFLPTVNYDELEEDQAMPAEKVTEFDEM